MSRLVPAAGPRSARIAIIGEAPASQEVAQGKPFVGFSGQLLNRWLASVGLDRQEVWIDNVYPYQAPGNKIERVPRAELAPWIHNLHERLEQLDDPWVIVPLGNTALRALTGKDKVTKHRGSIYEYTSRTGRRTKVIPSIHPAAIFRTPTWERRCLGDWRRIASDSQFRDLRLPERDHRVKPTLSDVEDYLCDAALHADALAIDIETPRKRSVEIVGQTKAGKPRLRKTLGAARITCVGFAYAADCSLTIPTTEDYWGTDLPKIWEIIAALCKLPCPKILQNGHFDTWWLARFHNVTLRNWIYDCKALHHCMDPADDHDLAYMASVDTREPYWKDDTKTTGDLEGDAPDIETFWRYNGKDCCVEWELGDLYAKRLMERGLRTTYHRQYADLFQPLLSASLTGLAVAQTERKRRASQLQAACIGLEDQLTALAGQPLYAKKALSNKKLQWFLYDSLRLPKQFAKNSKGEKAVTTNEVTVRKLMIRYPEKLREAGTLILDHRRKKKLSEFLDDTRVDADGRYRSSYGFTPETGRLSSGKNPFRTGGNAQNTDHEVRDIYVPDAGCVFLEVDLSQAEDRIVKMLAYAITRDRDVLWRACAQPWENDEHVRTARIIFRTDKVSYDQRQMGKKTNHASNYDMHGNTMSDNLLKEGTVYTPDECEAMLNARHDADPFIHIWHKQIRMDVMRDRALANPWGWSIDFQYERLNDDLYRRAYAWIPQSTVPQIINRWGWVPLHEDRKHRGWYARVHVQMHDSLLLSCKPTEAYEVALCLKNRLERPLTYGGTKMVIPVEIKLGRTWACSESFKRFPTREEFEAAVARVHP